MNDRRPRPGDGTRIAMVGTAGRRTELFTAACRTHGLADPRLILWRDLLGGARPALEPGTLLRIDSPGEDAETDTLLRGPGDPARVPGGARWYATFVAALHRLQAATGAGTLLNDPGEIAVMFDKGRCHARLEAAGVPVPAALPPVSGYAGLRARMAEAGWSRVFVKPAHGSSASGVVALQAHGARVRAVTSAVPGPDGVLRNSLRVRPYEDGPQVRALIDALSADGLHVERWLPKLSMGGRALDLRVVVIGGEPTHAVVRTSRHPMTNLHLGGARGDLTAVRQVLGGHGWERAMEICAHAARCFPRSLMVGVDLLIAVGGRRFAVGEVNAFGDLLPGLTGLPGTSAEGLDTYAAQVAAALSRRRVACAT